MIGFFRSIGHLVYHSGTVGLLTVGFLDSTFLIIPFGNDLLLIALSAHHHSMVPVYALAATAGSVLGCWVTIWLSSKGGASVRKRVSLKRQKYVQRQVAKRAGWAVGFASIMPPPFPFTPFVAAAAAFNYPRKKLFTIIAGARFARFAIEGGLGIYYERWILGLAKSETLRYIIASVIILSIIASAYSVYSWIKASGSKSSSGHSGTQGDGSRDGGTKDQGDQSDRGRKHGGSKDSDHTDGDGQESGGKRTRQAPARV
jgi:membrane protein YqaA with SNARE-associated domain